MLSKEEQKIISKIGRYKYNKMKELGLSYEEFLEYERKQKQEKGLKAKVGYRTFNKMKELGLNYEQLKQYQKEQKFKKYERKREKDKIRFKTIRYIERYCNLDMKCQICETEEDVQIHHPNYNEYLKKNLLCRKHHVALHNFELIPPPIIDLEEIAVKERPRETKTIYIEEQIEKIREDIFQGYTYTKLANKYHINEGTIARRLSKENDWKILEEKLKENGKKRRIEPKSKNIQNPIQEYRLKHNLSRKELSFITGVSAPTITNLEKGKTDIDNIRQKTKQKLNFILQQK